jgi:hypothetical protein
MSDYQQSFGVPLKYKCSRCSKGLHVESVLRGPIGEPSRMLEFDQRRALACDRCQIVICKECASNAARAKLIIAGYICPACGGDVRP